MMFALRAFVESTPKGKLSRIACFHYAQTLQTLQARLNEVSEEVDGQTAAISDATIMVVSLGFPHYLSSFGKISIYFAAET